MASPKIKSVGKLGARASAEKPTKRASDYDVGWVSGLTFRNSSSIAAVCITSRGRDPKTSGLHMTTEAGRDLARLLNLAASQEQTSVEVTNHSGGDVQPWQRFSNADAVLLADRLAGVSGG